MTRVVPVVDASAPPMSASVPLMALVLYQGGSPTPSVGRCVDSCNDELVDIVAPLLYC
jgi:hypothetical protein